FDVQATPSGITGPVSLLQLHGTVKGVYQFLPKTRVLARLEVGRIFTNRFRALPPTIRFFAGGDQSVRGFGYLQLGPTDSLGNVIGGPALVVSSVEVDRRVLPRWFLAAFTDYGNATNTLSLSGLEQSVGVGIRFLAPIGLIRVDVAMPVSRSGAPIRLHFSIGPDL